jgi:hypothetical protein
MNERRENQVEMVRKPLLTTRNQKRTRRDDGEWATDQLDHKMIVTQTGRVQTPITSFLVTQTIEERRNLITKRQITKPAVVKDMSASPALRKSKIKKKGMDSPYEIYEKSTALFY